MKRTFSSFRYRNYRLFFGGQTISQTGSWMQRIALGWFVLQLTNSSFDVGVMAFAQFLPFMVFGLFAGVVTDRLDARKLVIATQAGQLVNAIVLSWLVLAHLAQPWMLYTIAFVNGLVLVLDVPSRQQLTYRMVGRDQLPNAIALNSSLFNASRIFGPSAAGIVLGFAGAGVCFLINAISFLAVLLGLFAMRTKDFFPIERFERPAIWQGTREGVAFVLSQRRMLSVLALTLVLSTFCFNFNVTLPVLAYKTLHTHEWVYALLSAMFGAGALAGALIAASRSRASLKLMLAGSLVFTGAQLVLAPLHTIWLTAVMLFVIGAGFTVWSANSNSSVQLAAPDHLRGRIIGIYFYCFNGTAALSGVMAGWLCARGGTQLAFAVAAVIGVIATVAAAMQLRGPREARVRSVLPTEKPHAA